MRLTPAIRISLGLVSITISLLLLGKIIGFAPDQTRAVLESRKNLSEALAVQFSSGIRNGDVSHLTDILTSMVERNDEVKSAAIRKIDGQLLAETGEHLANWKADDSGRSTTTHFQIPIFKGEHRWGTVEVSFTPLWKNSFTKSFKNSYLSLILFTSFAGFAGYFLLIKKTLRELDPSTVVPGRVRAAFDILKEGVLIIDENELIVLANTSFSEIIGKSPEELIGFKGSELGWKNYRSSKGNEPLPWMEVLQGKQSKIGARLIMEGGQSGHLIFVVNAAVVLDSKGDQRGVLVTFDNITELEEKNLELNQAVNSLQATTNEVQTQNKELEFLANHDPMTQLLNRRAFTRDFYQLFHYVQKHSANLSCIMCDIDHFKAVNDNYGHATGDKVIIMVAKLLQRYFRKEDLIGRYGGEEFCIVMPGTDIGQAAAVADRVRKAIKQDISSGVQITMSFGVTTMNATSQEPDELSAQADKALYVAKESGRNCVVCWGDEKIEGFTSVTDGADEQVLTVKKEREDTPEEKEVHIEDVQRLTIRLKETEQLAEKRAQQLKHHTAFDTHTGLPTRVLFHDRVSQALLRSHRSSCFVVVLSISVDAIQRVNETLGFKEGDLLFAKVGKRLTEVLRGMDTVVQIKKSSQPTVGRLGQEEIGVLLTELKDIHAITWIVKRLLGAFRDPYPVEGNDIYAATNIGIAVSPQDGDSPDVLMRNATAAKSHARKNLGENKYYYYSESINAVSIQHLHLEKQLHRAVANDEFRLYYQAKIDATTGEISGMEALIRWLHPETGLIPPNRFIPVAEYSGMIATIGEWVIRAACKQIRCWTDMGLTGCNIAVNVSNRQFRQPNFITRIKEILEEQQLDPGLLTIEVTESTMMENIGNSLESLQALSNLGVGIALDDFGTGYSSLGYLKNFPVSHVKIDRSFVADIVTSQKDATMVKAIINMAHAMGIQVTAEGVENKEQIEHLLGCSCDEMQGFYFSKGVPAKEATELLKSGIGAKAELWGNRKRV